MSESTLSLKSIEIDSGYDGIVVVRALGDLPGGRTLDVSGVDSDTTVLHAGHVLIQSDTDATEILPLTVTDGAYEDLPDGYSYIGILKNSITVSDPRAAILTMGQVNAAAAETAVGAAITDTIKTALPQIQFIN